jgi:hypothetical protein
MTEENKASSSLQDIMIYAEELLDKALKDYDRTYEILQQGAMLSFVT